MLSSKVCTKCHQSKTLDEFYKSKRGLYGRDSYCKICQRQRSLTWHYANKEYSNKKSREYQRSHLADPLYKEKANQRSKDRYRANPEPQKRKSKEYREKNSKYYREYLRKYYQENKDKFNDYRATRGNRIAQRTPAWANIEAIENIYREARRLSLETGTLYHVDHIIPINGDGISGLHVESNLRIIPATENLRKKNKVIPKLVEALLKKGE